MKIVAVNESMFGNTRAVAEQIADGMREVASVAVFPVAEVNAQLVGSADLVIIVREWLAGHPVLPTTRWFSRPGATSRSCSAAAPH